MIESLKIQPDVYAALRRAAGRPPQYIEDLHPKQAVFVQSRTKRRAALTGRRGGKSHGVGAWLTAGAEEHPKRKSLFIALTRGKAKSILWDDCLAGFSDKYGLGARIAHDEGQLYIRFPNGHRIWLLGIDDKSQIDKVRGEKLHRVVIDEAQAFGDMLRELVTQAIEPALMDYDGELTLTGTPSASPSGFFWAATTGQDPEVQKWETHHWTVLDNPFIKNAARWLEDYRAANKWSESHPTYVREYLGQWTEDRGALIYPFTHQNTWQPTHNGNPFGLPDGEYTFGLGIDLGFSLHSTAFVLVAVRRGTGQVFVLRAYTRSCLIPTALAAHVDAIRNEVKRETAQWDGGKGVRVVVDEGALGVGYAEQMREMGVGCEAAEKREKRTYQEFVRGMILSTSSPEADGSGGSGVLVHWLEARELLNEARFLQFDETTGKEDERCLRHCSDSLLYIVRAMVPRYEPKLNPPRPGSPEAINAEMRRERQKAIDAAKKRQQGAYR